MIKLTWLHISDFHFRGGDAYDREVVLRALVASLPRLCDQGWAPEVVFATGDVAHSGTAAEYEAATRFFDDLLRVLGLERRRLFVIPGNHDVDRRQGVYLRRTLESREEADDYFAPGAPFVHGAKLAAFTAWHDAYFAGVRASPPGSTCGPVEVLDLPAGRLAVLPISSALFCQDDHDHRQLWVGRRCLDGAVAELERLTADLRIALIHHPLDWLHDVERSNVKGRLQGAVDLVLRGHLHDSDVEDVAGVGGRTLHLAAGAAYQTREWPNRALLVRVDGGRAEVFPLRYEDNPREVWTLDPSLFPGDPGYRRRFDLPRLAGSTGAGAEAGRATLGADHAGDGAERSGDDPASARSDVTLAFGFEVGEAGAVAVELRVDGGEPVSATFELDLAASQTAKELAAITAGVCTADDVQNLGSELWTRLQGGAIEEAVAAARKRCRERDGVLQVRLALPPSLEALPWEALFDFEESTLATSPGSAVVRAPVGETTARTPRARAEGPLRMLVVLPAGSGLAADAEWEKIQQAVRPAGARAVVERLDGEVTAERLAAALREPWDVVHYIGHGRCDEPGRVKLRLNGPGGAEHWMTAQTFAQPFLRSAVRLVVLNCCHAGAVAVAAGTTTAGPASDLGGLGGFLLKARVPAVVVMRYEIADNVAADFSRALYHELLAGRQPGRIDLAVQEGRATLLRTYGEGKGARAYVTPALYLAAGAEQLFTLSRDGAEAVDASSAGETIDPRIPEKLINALATRRCLPILGPELLSVGAHRDGVIAPDPGELARSLGTSSKFPDIEKLVALAISSASWLEPLVFERICQHFSSVAKGERGDLNSAIQELYRRFDPPEMLTRIARWPVPGIVYSHVDGLLERALFQERGRNLRALGPESLHTAGPPAPDELLLFNLRGNYAVPQSMVLTESDQDPVLDRMGEISALVESRMNATPGCTLLFLGVSPRDPLVRALGRRLLRAEVAKNRGTAYFVAHTASAADRAYWLEQTKLEWIELDAATVLHGLGVAADRALAAGAGR